MSDSETLQAAIDRHLPDVPPEIVPRLADYCRLLWDWNERLNLTRHTDAETFVTRDLVDTLQLLPFLESGSSVVDVGAGGGVPGLPLAILRPDLRVTLVESLGRKADALRAIVAALSLPVTVQAVRAESHVLQQPYDILTARAVAALPKLLQWFRTPLLNGQLGRLLLIKGPRWTEERELAEKQRITKQLSITPVASWKTVGRDGDSVLLEVIAQR